MSTDIIKDVIERTKDWEHGVAHDEWYFAKLRDDLISKLSPPEAFESIDPLVDYILTLTDPHLCLELIVIVNSQGP